VCVTIFFADFYVVIFIIFMSNLRSFAGKTGETQIDDGFTRYTKLVSVSTNGSRSKLNVDSSQTQRTHLTHRVQRKQNACV